MSRRRVPDGVDERGRPRMRWEDTPELGRALPTNPPGPVERRFVEPSTDVPPRRRRSGAQAGKPALGSREHMQQSRMRGARRHVTSACLCGDVIRASNKPHLIEAAVGIHNETPRHTRWAIENGWRDG